MKSFITALVLFSSAALFAQPSVESAASGDPIASVQSGDWQDASTWDCSCVPSAANDVTIQSTHAVSIATGDTARVESIALSAGATLALPEGTRLEVGASLASTGDINGTGIVAFVGEEDHACGPAKLGHLACGSGILTVMDTLRITEQIDIEDATISSAGNLVLEGTSGMTAGNGSIEGNILRRYTWEKESPFNYYIGSGVQGALASDLLELDGALYVKQWVESTTSYLTLLDTDELGLGVGFNCFLSAGTHQQEFSGTPILEADIELTNDAGGMWGGWNLVSNPTTGFLDLTDVEVTGPGQFGATYHWVDSLWTFVAQVDGLGQFHKKGILEPGEAFYALMDTSVTVHCQPSNLKDKDQWQSQFESESLGTLGLEIQVEERRDQCILEFGSGSGEYDRAEDAAFNSAFRGRNNLDMFVQSEDDVKLVISRTHADAQVIPLWVKALDGETVNLEATHIPDNICLMLEDVATGALMSLDAELSHSFVVNGNGDNHLFNIIVGGTVEATATDAACVSALDGTIAVTGPDMTSGFSLTDEAGNPAGTFTADSTGGTFSGLAVGIYTVTALTDGCADVTRTVEVGAGGSGASAFAVAAMPDHIGCYDDHGGIALEIEGGLAPYTVEWAHGVTGDDITVEEAGIFAAVITDAAGCSDSTTVEVFAAPQVEAVVSVDEAVVTLMDGEAEVHFENASNGATAYNWNFGDGGTSTSENPTHLYTEAGAYTVGLNAWNDYCSDTYQMVVTVETVSAIGQVSGTIQPTLARQHAGWTVSHPAEAFEVEVFDLTGRVLHRASGMPGQPVMLDAAGLPPVSLIYWSGQQSGQQQTWRVAR